jgi:hypothetical protein
MEMPTVGLARAIQARAGVCWMVNHEIFSRKNSTWVFVGRASRLASVLGEAKDDGSGTFAGYRLVVVVLRVSK